MLSEKRKRELLFPYEKVRPIQEELLLDIEKSLKEKCCLIANAPTGLGKTISALGPALALALKKNLLVFFLTNRNTQHHLAIETLRAIQKKFRIDFICVDLIGKRWMCSQEVKGLYLQEFHEFCRSLKEKEACEFLNKVKKKNKLTPEAHYFIEDLRKQGLLHNEELVSQCRKNKFCSYEISLELAKKARVIISDYYYLFCPSIQQKLFTKLNRSLEETILIIDEAHNLPKRVLEMLSLTLTNQLIKRAILEARTFNYAELIPALNRLNFALLELNNFDKKRSAERLVKKEEFIKKITPEKDYFELIFELELAGEEVRKKRKKSFIGRIATFLSSWLGEDQGFVRLLGEKTNKQTSLIYLSYLCLDPSLVTKPIFKNVFSSVLMSGTLYPPTMYRDLLGIKGKEKNYSNPFPSKNKLTLIVPETTTRYRLRGQNMYKKIAEKCSQILKLIPGNCALFFPSYELRDAISFYLKTTKRIFWEKGNLSKEENNSLLDEFKKACFSSPGAVLLGVLGGNYAEGVDFPGNLLRAVLIVGLPLAKPDLKTKELIKYYEKKFNRGWEYGYLYPAIIKCLQGAGRCIRSASDKGAIIFLDERFSWPNYLNCFPKENLIITKEFVLPLKRFFNIK